MTNGERLRNEPNIWLSTTRPNGRPHLTPIWFVYVRDRFWIGTGLHNVKTRNATANPAVSVALENGNNPVVAEGQATIHHTHRPNDVAAAFQAKYDWDITIANDPDVGTVALWEITPTKWLYGNPNK